MLHLMPLLGKHQPGAHGGHAEQQSDKHGGQQLKSMEASSWAGCHHHEYMSQVMAVKPHKGTLFYLQFEVES